MRKEFLSTIILVLIFSISLSISLAYGDTVMEMDLVDEYKTWVFIEEFPIWIGTECTSNLFQDYMVEGQYVEFHGCTTFAKQDEWSYPYSQYSQVTYAGSERRYYKESELIGSTSMPYDGNIMVSPNWIWDNRSGNTDGDVIGEGYGTYYAKSTSAFVCSQAVWPTNSIDNSVSIGVTE